MANHPTLWKEKIKDFHFSPVEKGGDPGSNPGGAIPFLKNDDWFSSPSIIDSVGD